MDIIVENGLRQLMIVKLKQIHKRETNSGRSIAFFVLKRLLQFLKLKKILEKIFSNHRSQRDSIYEGDDFLHSAKSSHHATRKLIGVIDKKTSLFIFVSNTDVSFIEYGTGIITAMKNILQSLKDQGQKLIFVTIDHNAPLPFNFKSVNREYLKKLGFEQDYLEMNEIELNSQIEGQSIFLIDIPYHSSLGLFQLYSLSALVRSKKLNFYVVFYDNFPLELPFEEEISLNHREYLRIISEADLIFPISKFSKSSLIKFLNLFQFQKPPIAEKILPYNFKEILDFDYISTSKEERFYLLIGSFETRKNWSTVFQAIQNYSGNHKFIAIGHAQADLLQQLYALEREKNFKYLGFVDKNLKLSLIKDCNTILFPSIFEGLGYPPIESIFFGKVPIVADTDANRDVLEGFEVEYVKNFDNHDSWIKVLEKFDQKDFKNQSGINLQRSKEKFDPLLYSEFIIDTINRNAREKNSNIVILYFVDYIRKYPGNSGIQMVIRELAKALIGMGVKLVPIKFSLSDDRFEILTITELENISNFNGPNINDWFKVDKLELKNFDFCIIPELTTYADDSDFLSYLLDKFSHNEVKVNLILYDLLPIKLFPEVYSQESYEKHKIYLEHTSKAHHVSCISKSTYIDYLEFVRKDSRYINPRIEVSVNTLPNNLFKNKSVQQEKDRKKIIYVASFEKRKNHSRLVKAFKKIQKNNLDLELHLVGRFVDSEIESELKQYLQEYNWLFYHDTIDDIKLQELYQEAFAAVYVSLGEGFGLPIIEALAYNLFCLVGSEREVGDLVNMSNVISCDVRDVKSIERGLRELIIKSELNSKDFTQDYLKDWNIYARLLTISMLK